MRSLGLLKTEGIVTKTTKFSETSLIVTIITRDLGKISAIANNVRSSKSQLRSGLQLFAYSEIVLYEGRGKTGLYKINEMTLIEGFSALRSSLEKLAYASYFAEIANRAVSEEEPDAEILRLLLNCLFALDKGLCPEERVKMVFQWRTAILSGYEPSLEVCCGCSLDEAEEWLFSLGEGRIFCPDCGGGVVGGARLTEGMRRLLLFLCHADSKKLFAFEAGEKTVGYLSELGERYIELQLDQRFSTLQYLKKVLNPEF